MNKMTSRFKAADIFYIIMMALPIALCILLKVLTAPLSEGISISGARIFFTIPLPIQNMPVTESQVHSLAVIISLLFLCLYLTHGITEGAWLKRHHIAEIMVEMCKKLVVGNMGEYFRFFTPFIAAIMGLSAFSSLITLFGLYPPTSDLNVVAGWAILVFI